MKVIHNPQIFADLVSDMVFIVWNSTSMRLREDDCQFRGNTWEQWATDRPGCDPRCSYIAIDNGMQVTGGTTFVIPLDVSVISKAST